MNSVAIFNALQGLGSVSLLTCAFLYVVAIKRRNDERCYKKLVFDRLLTQVVTKHRAIEDIDEEQNCAIKPPAALQFS